MKLFGSKNNQDDTVEDLDDGALDMEAMDDAFDSTVKDGGALSAPSRGFDGGGKRGGGRKGILAGLLLLVLAGGGGGYYYLTQMQGADVPAQPLVAAINPEQPAVNVTADVLGQPAGDNLLGLAVPPMPQPAEGMAADMPVDPFAPATPTPATDAAPVAMSVDAGLPADMTDPFAAMGAPPTDEPVTPLVAAPADDAALSADATAVDPFAAVSTPTTDASVTTTADATVQTTETPVTADGFATVTAPVMPDIPAAPPLEDLPMPTMMETTTAATAPTAPAAAPVAVQPPNNAEMAIVQNAAVLDQLSTPAAATAGDPAARGKTVDEILGTPALIRPMPPSYVTVRKDSSADIVSVRLKQARYALSQNKNSGALMIFNELYAEYPRDNRVLMGRALALQKLGQRDQALAAYEDVLNNDPKNLDALTNMLGLLKNENPQVSLAKLVELQSAYPYNADIAAQLGVAYGGARSYEQALKYFDMAEALRPGSAYVMYNKAVLFDRMGQRTKASALYRLLVQMDADGQMDAALPIEQIRQRLSTIQ